MDEAALPTARITMAICAAYRMRGEQRGKKQREARFLCDEVRQASSWVRKKLGISLGVPEGQRVSRMFWPSGYSFVQCPDTAGTGSDALGSPPFPDRQTDGCPSATACEAAAGAGGAG